MKKKEMRKFLEGAIDRILIKKNNEKKEKIQLEKKETAEKSVVNSLKESLHDILKDTKWEEMGVVEAKELLKKMKKWTTKYTK